MVLDFSSPQRGSVWHSPYRCGIHVASLWHSVALPCFVVGTIVGKALTCYLVWKSIDLLILQKQTLVEPPSFPYVATVKTVTCPFACATRHQAAFPTLLSPYSGIQIGHPLFTLPVQPAFLRCYPGDHPLVSLRRPPPSQLPSLRGLLLSQIGNFFLFWPHFCRILLIK